MKKILALAAASVLPLTACGSSDSSAPASSSASPPSASASVSSSSMCKALSAATPDAKAAAAVKLTGGLMVTDVQEMPSSDDKSKRDVTVRVCGASTTGDALKAEAQKIGAALKKASDAKTISSLRVTNLDKPDDAKARVRCEDFQMNTFEGAVGTEVATWKTSDEN